MSKVLEHKLIEEFHNKEFFSRKDLLGFYLSWEPNLKEGTFAWRIYDLKNRNIIKVLKRGLYTISHKSDFAPELSSDTIRLARRITDRFEDVQHCIWETTWLNEFSQHQASRQMTIIEIEKGFEESLFYEMKEYVTREIYLKPDAKVIELYVTESGHPIVINNLITRSPLETRMEKKAQVSTPLLEKILVDIFVEEKLFSYVQGAELIHIYENALSKYSLNFTKLFSYAKRRHKAQAIKEFMTNHLSHLVKDIIDD